MLAEFSVGFRLTGRRGAFATDKRLPMGRLRMRPVSCLTGQAGKNKFLSCVHIHESCPAV